MVHNWFNKSARQARAATNLQKSSTAVHKHAGKIPPPFWDWRRPWVLPVAVFYIWYTSLLKVGYKRPLTIDDEFALPEHLKTRNSYPYFWKGWTHRMEQAPLTKKGRHKMQRAEDGKEAPHLWPLLLRQHASVLLSSIFLQAIYNAFNFSGPVLLGKIVTFLQTSAFYETARNNPAKVPAGVPFPPPPNVKQAYVFAVLIFVFPLVGAIALVHSNRLAIQVQIKLRAELTTAVYQKAMRLSARAKQQTETGRVVNIMSADVNNIIQFFYPMMAQLFVAPCILIASLILLWFQIRWATFIAMVLLLTGTPLTGIFVKKLTGLRRRMLLETDTRVKLMNQLLTGIRVLKLYAWESAQEAAVLEARKRELGRLRQAIPPRVGMQVLLFATPTLAAVISFASYGSADPGNFTAPHIFSAIAYFSIMRFPLIFLPFALVQLGSAMVSMRRLNQFLVLEERTDSVERLENAGAQIEGGCFFWAEPPKEKEDPKKTKKAAKKEKNKKRRFLRRKKALKQENLPDEDFVVTTASMTNDSDSAIQPIGKSPGKVSSDVDTAMEDGRVKGGVQSSSSSDRHSGDGDGIPRNLPLVGLQEAIGKNIGEPVVEVEDRKASASWWLNDINLRIEPGQLVAIVGRVGCGKSSLVNALLGEMERSSGRVAIGGSMAYVAQQAWILNATLKDNVLFGQPYDEARWEAVIKACSLGTDLEVLPAGAETEIGEKGINLSGGQKQRISMARAVYSDADFYILDDPLSAVDVHVGRHMFDECIRGELHGKTRMLVTNQLQFLDRCDKIVFMQQGRIVAQGTFQEVCRNPAMADLLAEFNSTGKSADQRPGAQLIDDPSQSPGSDADVDSETPEVDLDAMHIAENVETEMLGAFPRQAGQVGSAMRRRKTFYPPDEEGRESIDSAPTVSRRLLGGSLDISASNRNISQTGSRDGAMYSSRRSIGAPHTSRRSFAGTFDPHSQKSLASAKSGDLEKGEVPVPAKQGQLITTEDQETGQIGKKVYWYYMKAYGLKACVTLILFWATEQTIRVLTQWWLSQWTESEGKRQVAERLNLPYSNNRTRYIGGYFGFAIAFVIMTMSRALLNLYSAWGASGVIHRRSLHGLIGTTVAFFDTTPIGRILNRFAKDTDDMDYLLPQSVTEFGNCLMQLLSTLIFISIIQPYFLAGMIPLMGIYFFIQRYYRKSYINLQRIDATTRSPIYAHFSETLTGVDTLRAYGYQERFAASNETKVDHNHRAYFNLRMADQWLSWRLDCISSCLILLVGMLAIAQRRNLSPSLTALSLSEVLDVTGFLKYAVQAAAMFESRFNSVERLMTYMGLPQEAPGFIEATKPADDWPTEGGIAYKDVWMRYRPDLPPVLRGVSFEIAAGQKIGICGRTGSGKSSLIVSLFRIVEPYKGAILMDGVDLLTLGLHEVRSRIATIPQDPVLFSGTVRSNLDPFNRASDTELWTALDHVNLKEHVGGLAGGIEARVAEGGENWSQGSRQLLCVARALLRKPRVLVADEATASVDAQTDALIQQTIRKHFTECTALTIAHRINTILDSDKVLVMDDGRVAEFDNVPNLVARPESAFRSMVVEANLGGAFGL